MWRAEVPGRAVDEYGRCSRAVLATVCTARSQRRHRCRRRTRRSGGRRLLRGPHARQKRRRDRHGSRRSGPEASPPCRRDRRATFRRPRNFDAWRPRRRSATSLRGRLARAPVGSSVEVGVFGLRKRPSTRAFTVGEGGLEPPHPFGHRNLNPARLPIPPLARVSGATLAARAKPPQPQPPVPSCPWACRASSGTGAYGRGRVHPCLQGQGPPHRARPPAGAGDGRQPLGRRAGRTIVPNDFTFPLAPDDVNPFAEIGDALIRELSTPPASTPTTRATRSWARCTSSCRPTRS